MIGKYTIAICDILGFKDLVKNRPLDEVIHVHLEKFYHDLWWSVYLVQPPNPILPIHRWPVHTKVGIAGFSDTIMLWTLADQDENLQELIRIVNWLLLYVIITTQTRVRCGISYGEAFIDNDKYLFVGRPIVDAYLLEEAQNWSGAALTEEAENRVGLQRIDSDYQGEWPLVAYDVPMKKSEKPSKVAVNWNVFHSARNPFPKHKSRNGEEHEEPQSEDWMNDRNICEIYVNTKKFHEQMCASCKKREL